MSGKYLFNVNVNLMFYSEMQFQVCVGPKELLDFQADYCILEFGNGWFVISAGMFILSILNI